MCASPGSQCDASRAVIHWANYARLPDPSRPFVLVGGGPLSTPGRYGRIVFRSIPLRSYCHES